MKVPRAIRITLLLIIIFAAGVITGRVTAPRPRTMISIGEGRFVTSEVPFQRLNRQLSLSPEQEQNFRALLERIAQQMSKLPPSSQERLELFRRSLPEMEALLRPEQKTNFQQYVRDVEARFERQIRNRETEEGLNK